MKLKLDENLSRHLAGALAPWATTRKRSPTKGCCLTPTRT
jgi:hypothetical protein